MVIVYKLEGHFLEFLVRNQLENDTIHGVMDVNYPKNKKKMSISKFETKKNLKVLPSMPHMLKHH